MEKKVGKFFYCLWLITTALFGSNSAILMIVQDNAHNEIKQAMTDVPFLLRVELTNLSGINGSILESIPGLDKFTAAQVVNTMQSSMIEHGKRTKKLVYDIALVASHKGVYEIGRISLPDAFGKKVISNFVKIAVEDEIIPVDTKQDASYFMSMHVADKSLYVGQLTELVVEFYDRIGVQDLHLQMSENTDLFIVASKRPLDRERVQVAGQEYVRTRWIFDIYPKKSGRVIIQGIQAAFFMEQTQDPFGFGGGFSFFKLFDRQEQFVKAYPIALQVMSLPDDIRYQGVTTVGIISDYQVSFDQSTLQAGKGAMVKITLSGTANFQMAHKPVLQLPQGMVAYDSATPSMSKDRSSIQFESVIQSTYPGDYTIQAQPYTYFDPWSHEYKTIKSNSFGMTIEQAPVALQSSKTDDLVEQPVLESEDRSQVADIQFLPYCVPIVDTNVVPWSLFTFLLGLIWLCWIVLNLHQYIHKKLIKKNKKIRYLLAFYQVRKSLRQARQQNQYQILYRIVMQLFSQLIDIESTQLSGMHIVDYMKAESIDFKIIDLWLQVEKNLLELTFDRHHDGHILIFDQVNNFIDSLQGALCKKK